MGVGGGDSKAATGHDRSDQVVAHEGDFRPVQFPLPDQATDGAALVLAALEDVGEVRDRQRAGDDAGRRPVTMASSMPARCMSGASRP